MYLVRVFQTSINLFFGVPGTMVKRCSIHPVKKISRKLGIKGFMVILEILKNILMKTILCYTFFHWCYSFPLTLNILIFLEIRYYQILKRILTISGLEITFSNTRFLIEQTSVAIFCSICFNEVYQLPCFCWAVTR